METSRHKATRKKTILQIGNVQLQELEDGQYRCQDCNEILLSSYLIKSHIKSHGTSGKTGQNIPVKKRIVEVPVK